MNTASGWSIAGTVVFFALLIAVGISNPDTQFLNPETVAGWP